MLDIDLVYLWCSSADSKFANLINQTREKLLLSTMENKIDTRTADHNELRYSLRSVEKFAPWIHHIYIVTYQQVPKWLNIHHPKITVVDHSEIIPAEYLPTFNSNVIEAFIHKIPGLSEHFLYANDDQFFGKETSPDFFFNKDNLPIHYPHPVPKYTGEYYGIILKKSKKLAEDDVKRFLPFPNPYPSHQIDAYTKSLYADTVEHFFPYYKKMFPNKFRRENDIQRILISCWGLLKNRLLWGKPKGQNNKLFYFDIINEKIFNDFLKSPVKPNLFCINDQEYLDETDYQNHTKILQILFPNKSEFEIDDDITPIHYPDYGLKPAFKKNNISVVLTVDEKFLPYCGVTITSLIQHISDQYNYDIIVLCCGGNLTLLKDLMQAQLPQNVSLRLLDVTSFLVKHRRAFMKDFSPEKVSKWTRVFIHKWLNHYEKILYLDADVLVKCDVAELWNMDLAGKAVGGVIDMSAHYFGSNKEKLMNDIFHCDSIDDYINLGVMVMDLNALRQMNFTQKFLDLIASVPKNFWNLYDLFNALLHKNIVLLPMTYNYQNSLLVKNDNLYPFFEDSYYLAFQRTTNEGPKIVHFSVIQPWQKMLGRESVYWWKIAKKTDFHEMILMSIKLPQIPKMEEQSKVKADSSKISQ